MLQEQRHQMLTGGVSAFICFHLLPICCFRLCSGAPIPQHDPSAPPTLTVGRLSALIGRQTPSMLVNVCACVCVCRMGGRADMSHTHMVHSCGTGRTSIGTRTDGPVDSYVPWCGCLLYHWHHGASWHHGA
eukprot:3983852-Prymnesium_polylepis.1